jgi:hypothetical protein
MNRFRSEINGYQLLALMSCDSTFSQTHPHAYRIVHKLHAGCFRVSEVNFYEHSVWIGLSVVANFIVYNRRGKVLVQGAIWEHGHYGKRLKALLPPNTVWQARLK